MTAWFVFGSGCAIVVLGVLVLGGWRSAQYKRPFVAGGGAVAVGAGLALDGVPKLLGWSAHTGFAMATVGAALVVCGSVAQVIGGPARKPPR